MMTDTNGPPPAIEAVATALPGHEIRQSDAEALARRVFDRDSQDVDRLMPVFANAGIEKRYSCMPLDWYRRPHGWRERNELFERHAVTLIEQAATTCLERAGKCPADVNAIVCVSTTGITTPGLDARLMNRMPFRRDTKRLPVFGLGCAGGVIGLARAAALQRSMPESRVLLLVVELCTLTFRESDSSKSNFIATALFGDGAAAALIGPDHTRGPTLGPAGEFTWPNSLPVMGWRVEDDGFGVLFSRDIPDLVRRELRIVTDGFLAAHGLSRRDLAGYICHPGGTKVLAALEEAFGIEAGALAISREILRDVGNLSAATVMFVLERMLANGLPSGRHLASSLGPGFTAAFQIIEAP
jgi:alkylresorcinol/alkylpyrone synthase